MDLLWMLWIICTARRCRRRHSHIHRALLFFLLHHVPTAVSGKNSIFFLFILFLLHIVMLSLLYIVVNYVDFFFFCGAVVDVLHALTYTHAVRVALTAVINYAMSATIHPNVRDCAKQSDDWWVWEVYITTIQRKQAFNKWKKNINLNILFFFHFYLFSVIQKKLRKRKRVSEVKKMWIIIFVVVFFTRYGFVVCS